jgi:hypothetical protein
MLDFWSFKLLYLGYLGFWVILAIEIPTYVYGDTYHVYAQLPMEMPIDGDS